MKAIIIIVSVIITFAVLIKLYLTLHPAFGGKPNETALNRYSKSKNYKDGVFMNSEPTSVMLEGGSMLDTMWEWIKGPENGKPDELETSKFDRDKITKANDSTVQYTWFGHSSMFLQVTGNTILIDPVFSRYASPVWFLNRSFNYTEPTNPEDLPYIDIVIISHDHYDHLDMNTIKSIDSKVGSYYVPLGVELHLIRWGVDSEKIVVADWWDEIEVNDKLKLTCTPARHFSGRSTKRNTTLWSSWVIEAPGGRIFFGGDSGYGEHFKQIGDKYGPFALTMIECGQYNQRWASIHAMPEESVQANIDLGGKNMIAIHWSKFQLALHPWTEPIKRARVASVNKGVNLIEPRIGEVYELNLND